MKLPPWKARIEQEVVKAGELERQCEIGSRGIREIEFVVPGAQLLRGGRQPFLQSPKPCPRLRKSWPSTIYSGRDRRFSCATRLLAAQCGTPTPVEDIRQTPQHPGEQARRQRLAALMGAASLKDSRKGTRLTPATSDASTTAF